MSVSVPEKVKKLYPFSPKQIQTPAGHTMSYLDEGEGFPVVMVHGNPSWSFLYRDVVKALSSSHRCIVPDHIGCGLSDKPQDWDYTLANHIENLRHLVNDVLKLESFDLIVHDWGGAIGMGLATMFPSKVRRIVITNTFAFEGKAPARIRLLRLPLWATFGIRRLNLFVRASRHMCTLKKLPAEVKEGFTFPYNSFKNRIAIQRFVEDIPLQVTHRSRALLEVISEKLEVLKGKPVLICWGNRDFCFTPAFADEWKRRFPEAKDCRYRAAHYVFEDAPEGIEEVVSFLSN